MGSPKITPNTSTSMSNKLFLIACLVAGVASFASVAETEPCECSGSQGKAAMQDYYPDDMGETCKPWDVGMDYRKAGGESFMETWCFKEWCYVEADCPGAAPGSYLSDIDGPQLYYSYESCGSTDTYTEGR